MSAGITLDTIDNNTVSMNSLLTLDLTFGLPANLMEFEDHDFLSKKLSCDVIRFTISITDKTHTKIYVDGSQLSEKAIKKLRMMRRGSQVYISDIYIRCGSKPELLNQQLSFTIK